MFELKFSIAFNFSRFFDMSIWSWGVHAVRNRPQICNSQSILFSLIKLVVKAREALAS